jgi:hypothetical protein
MGILHAQYDDGRHVRPVKTTIRFARHRLIPRLNDQTIRMNKIQRQLPLAIAGQLVTTSLREVAQIC